MGNYRALAFMAVFMFHSFSCPEDDAQIRGVPVGSPVGKTSPGPGHGKRGSNETRESSNDTNFSFNDGDSRLVSLFLLLKLMWIFLAF